MDTKKPLLPVKSDFVFKIIFGDQRNVDVLAAFLKSVLDIPDDDSTELWHWMRFIKSDNEEEIDMLATRSPQMRKAVGVLKELSADERSRMLYEKREMARMDFESRVADAEKRALIEVAKKLLLINLPIEQIVKIAGLTQKEIEALHDAE
ncbi:MAG: Rpn family recombination-promoting nuclease/putative transposase [Oscillospiraceae bacterium]|jgi:predicted transposase/invertase (TIGR01784 family)|nr:Rpn family recombination-promoting nuclease/putative transposase [Oscillospiraceae bacterium]